MIRRDFFHRLLGGIVTLVVTPVAAQAETAAQRRKRHRDSTPSPSPASSPALSPEPSPTPAPPGKEKEMAQLRLWKAADTTDQSFQFRLLPSDKSEAKAVSPFEIEAGGYQFSNYVEIPAGPMFAEISSSGRTTVLLPLHLFGGTQSTVLVRLQSTGLSAEWIDDTPNHADDGCEFVVYNLLPASGDIQIDLGTILTVHLASNRSDTRLRGIKKTTYPVVINGSDGTGKNFHWNAEVDFRQYRKAALLIYPDIYGRVRPRLVPV